MKLKVIKIVAVVILSIKPGLINSKMAQSVKELTHSK